MAKPKVTLHIFSSLDGRITGSYSGTPFATKLFDETGFGDDAEQSLHFDGWIYGKNTSVEGFGVPLAKDLPDARVPAGDYVTALGAKRYYVAIDPRGELAWQSQTTSYAGAEATVLEVLTHQASGAFRNYLRGKGIPYLIAGEKEVDFKLMLDKLGHDYERQNLMLGGGGILNWSMLDQGLVDEISLVMTPSVDGATNSARLFNSAYAGDSHAINFRPVDLRTYEDGTLWLRYRPVR